MASVGTTLRPSAAITLPGRAEPRRRSRDAQIVDAPVRRSAHDDGGDVFGLAIGCGVMLMQVCAIIPGLLPCLLLVVPLVLPFVVLGLAVGLLVGVPLGIWRLLALAWRSLGGRSAS